MKKKLSLLVLGLSLISFCADAQHFAWAKKGGSIPDYDYAFGIVSDAVGNTYVTGNFSGTATFGTFTLTSAGGTDLYLLKYDASGTIQWAKRGGGPGDDGGEGVVLNANGEIVVSGYFKSTSNFDGTTLVANGMDYDLVVLKYNVAGVQQWAKRTGGTGMELPTSMSTDQHGNYFIGGYFRGTAHFGNDSLVNVTPFMEDGFLTKMDDAGNFIWAKGIIGTTHQEWIYGISNDSLGNVFVCGGFQSDTARLGSTYILNSDATMNNPDVFYAKYNATGNLIWVKTGFGFGYKMATSIESDSIGNSYMTGFISSDITFNGQPTIYSSDNDMYVAKFDSLGNCLWLKQSTGTGEEYANEIYLDKNNHLYVAGYFWNQGVWDNDYILNADVNNNSDAVIINYDINGNVHWLAHPTGSDDASANSIATDASGNVFVTGEYAGNATFGSTILSGPGTSEIFVSKIDLLAAGIIPSPICAGATISVPYISTTTFNTGNVFTAQLSDAAGSFVSSVNIGTVSSTATSGTITSIIPVVTPIGTNYRIRVNSSNPAITGSWSNDFSVHPAPLPQELCQVTVDTLSTHNIVYWEKPTNLSGIDSFRIYREVTTNVYAHIASVHPDSLSEYHDYAANPNTTSFKYRITIFDSCGYETAPSLFHNTIHLQYLGSGNLQWTLYEIESTANPVNYYRVYRDDISSGNFLPISTTIPGGNTTYTDGAFNLYPSASYRVDVAWGIQCSPTRTTINTTRSNIKSNGMVTDIAENLELQQLSIFPNPATSQFEIKGVQSELEVRVINALGQVVFETIVTKENSRIETSSLNNGIYYLQIKNENGTINKKLIKQ